MDWTSLIAVLALVTLGVWVGIAFISKRKVESRMNSNTADKSTLAADKSSTGKPADV